MGGGGGTINRREATKKMYKSASPPCLFFHPQKGDIALLKLVLPAPSEALPNLVITKLKWDLFKNANKPIPDLQFLFRLNIRTI